MSILETALLLFSITFIARITPGPDMMLIIKYCNTPSATKRKRTPALICTLGVCSGLLVHISLSLFGLALIIKNTPVILTIISYLGACYLIYIGIKSLRFAQNISSKVFDKDTFSSAITPLKQIYIDGLLCNLLNPKATLFILSVFTQIIAPETAFGTKLLYASVIIGDALIGWTIFVFLLHTKIIQKFYSRYAILIDKFAGVLFLIFGISIFIKSL